MIRRPLCIELFAGTFGWSAGWLALGGRAIARLPERLSRHIAEVYWPDDAARAVEASA